MQARANLLAQATSPYLRQHASNPVWWRIWSDAAFAEARERDLPILVSIGYSTCHWCHVMAHESFENSEVAALMNERFVCIKVDREELPAVDAQYMSACQGLTGQGGWPLHAVCDHQGRPFFAGTYFPAEHWLQLLSRLSRAWQGERDQVAASAGRIADWIAEQNSPRWAGDLPGDVRAALAAHLDAGWDADHPGWAAGKGMAPKFPPSNLLLALLQTGLAAEQRDAVLTAMQDSGLHDRVGGGFHRYSVDRQWRVPHFEKMLYDNALLLAAYAQAGQRSQRADFLATARAIATYLERDLKICDAAGQRLGYAAAEDADDAGGEGSFYAWSPEALRRVLPEHADHLIVLWSLHDGSGRYPALGHGGHAEPVSGHIPHPRGSAAFRALDPAAQVRERLHNRAYFPALLAARSQRPRPTRDDKILTDHNGLALQGLAALAQIDPQWVMVLREQAVALRSRISAQGLMRLPEQAAYITDYGHLALGFTAAFLALGDPVLVETAAEILSQAEARLLAPEGDFYTTPERADLLGRAREDFDNAYPSGSAALALAAARLWLITGEERWRLRAATVCQMQAALLQRAPQSAATLVMAADLLLHDTPRVVIVGPEEDPLTQEFCRMARSQGGLGLMVIPVASCKDRPWPLLDGRRELSQPQALVCLAHRCLAPAMTVADFALRLTSLGEG